MSADQTWLNDWAANVTFTDTNHLSRKVFQEVLTHYSGKKIKYGPDVNTKDFVITVTDSNGVASVRIPVPNM